MDDQVQDQRVIDDAAKLERNASVNTVNAMPSDASGTVQRGLQSAGDTGGTAVDLTRRILKGAIYTTEELGGDLVSGVTHLAQDVIHGVREVGGDAGVVIKDGANGTVNAVGDVGGNTVSTLTSLMVGLVGGVRQVAGAAVGGARRTAAVTYDAGGARQEENVASVASQEVVEATADAATRDRPPARRAHRTVESPTEAAANLPH